MKKRRNRKVFACCEYSKALKDLNSHDGYIDGKRVWKAPKKWKQLTQCICCGRSLKG